MAGLSYVIPFRVRGALLHIPPGRRCSRICIPTFQISGNAGGPWRFINRAISMIRPNGSLLKTQRVREIKL